MACASSSSSIRCGERANRVDIANAVVFLCSDEASFITGHTLVVDGGMTIQLQENLGVHLASYAQAAPRHVVSLLTVLLDRGAAVDGEHRAGHHLGVVRDDEQKRLGDVLGRLQPAERRDARRRW